MKEIKEYEILGSESFEDLAKLVNKFIKKEWQPFGGLAITQEDDKIFFYQAIVKY